MSSTGTTWSSSISTAAAHATWNEPLSDKVDRRLADRTANVDVLVLNVDDPTDSRGTIYDFSKTVLDKLDRKIGTVIIGLSDIIIRDEIGKLVKFIIPISLLVLGIAIIASIIMATVTIRPIRPFPGAPRSSARGTWTTGSRSTPGTSWASLPPNSTR